MIFEKLEYSVQAFDKARKEYSELYPSELSSRPLVIAHKNQMNALMKKVKEIKSLYTSQLPAYKD